MIVELILDRIESNISKKNLILENMENSIKATRLKYKEKPKTKEEKELNKKIKKLLEKVKDNKYARLKIKNYQTETIMKNELINDTVHVGNESFNYLVSVRLSYLKDFDIDETDELEIDTEFLDIQALIFRVHNSSFDRYITFKIKRDWNNEQGIIQGQKLFNMIIEELLKNNFVIKAEIKKDKRSGYYIISKLIKEH